MQLHVPYCMHALAIESRTYECQSTHTNKEYIYIPQFTAQNTPGPLAMGLRGRGVAQQNRGSSGEGIWIIVKPIAGDYMMAILGAKVTLCEVAMLSICSGDMLAYYTAEEFV